MSRCYLCDRSYNRISNHGHYIGCPIAEMSWERQREYLGEIKPEPINEEENVIMGDSIVAPRKPIIGDDFRTIEVNGQRWTVDEATAEWRAKRAAIREAAKT